jgi:hypothetical protein
MNALPDFVRYLAGLAPYGVVWLVGLIVALVRWRRHPGVSLLASLGCGLLLVSLVGGSVLQYWLLRNGGGLGWSMSASMTALAWGRMLLNIPGYTLLLCALFGWRDPRSPDLSRYDEPERDWRGGREPDRAGRGGSEDIQKPRR